jgi:hypothetical protein
MRWFFRLLRALLAGCGLILGAAVLIGSVASGWQVPHLSLGLALHADAERQHTYQMQAYLQRGRLVGLFHHRSLSAKVGTSWPDATLQVGVTDIGEAETENLSASQAWFADWFAADARVWPHGRPADPSSTYVAERRLVVPAPLVGGGLLLLGVWWLVPTLKLFFRPTRVYSNHCLHCGAHLREVAGEVCPDCGAERPRVTISKISRT